MSSYGKLVSPTVRFAPSPTGRIHIGNARTAVFNWLFALKNSGRFVLRFDDTDRDRSTLQFERDIASDLAWLGIVPDLMVRQSDRFDLYRRTTERLKETNRLYPCYETQQELELRRKRQLARGAPPIYDRSALQLSETDRRQVEAQGRRPHWRFLLDSRKVGWTDLIRGLQEIDTATLSDPVLIREDGSYLYTLPSVADDIDLAVTHVIRGEDHVVNTAVQVQLFEALGAEPPQFAHHSLLVGADGQGLSKRLGSLSIAGLREQGIEAMAVASVAALIGTSESVHPVAAYEALLQGFDLAHVSRAPARFDEEELRSLNSKLVHELPYEAVRTRLTALGADGGPQFWQAVRGNLATLNDAQYWHAVIYGAIDPVVVDQDFLDAARRLLPPEPWGESTWKDWTGRLKEETGRRGKNLYHPLRLALTASEAGPELAALMPLIGRDRVERRLEGRR
ncbi:MAG TPA: glutamate--tRNA ligase [Aestuariivirgaceae bacterium]|nr:glutamate--tRNA ligase [Aestuariivirgaceae bacterium]